jgi:hypothetical protein
MKINSKSYSTIIDAAHPFVTLFVTFLGQFCGNIPEELECKTTCPSLPVALLLPWQMLQAGEVLSI